MPGYLSPQQLNELERIKRNRGNQSGMFSQVMQQGQQTGGPMGALGKIIGALIMKNKEKGYSEREDTLSQFAGANQQADMDIIKGAQPEELARVLLGSPNPEFQKMGLALATKPKPKAGDQWITETMKMSDGSTAQVQRNETTGQVKVLGKPKTEVNVTANILKEGLTADVNKVMVPALEAVEAANQEILAYDTLEQTLSNHMKKDPSWFTKPGLAPDLRLTLGRIAKSFGADIEGVDSAQDLARQTADMTVTQLNNMPGNPSDRDMAMVTQSVVNTSQDPNSMWLSINIGRAASKWSKAYNNRKSQFARQGKDATKFDDYFESIKGTDPELVQLSAELDSVIDTILKDKPRGKSIPEMADKELLKFLGINQ